MNQVTPWLNQVKWNTLNHHWIWHLAYSRGPLLLVHVPSIPQVSYADQTTWRHQKFCKLLRSRDKKLNNLRHTMTFLTWIKMSLKRWQVHMLKRLSKITAQVSKIDLRIQGIVFTTSSKLLSRLISHIILTDRIQNLILLKI